MLRELLDIQSQYEQDLLVVTLDFWRSHQQACLLEPKKRSAGDKTFLNEGAELLVVKRINKAAVSGMLLVDRRETPVRLGPESACVSCVCVRQESSIC